MRRPGPTFPSRLAAGVLGLTLALAAACAHAVPVPEVDPETNPFYKNVPDVSGMSRGDIIREEPAELDDSIFHGATGIRVMYVSVDVDGTTLVPATMMVFYPGTASSPVSDGLWRTMVWATGTVGIGDVCANSRYPYLYQGQIDDVWNGRWKPYGDVAYEMLSDGFITVAPDYVGTGPEVPGVGHSYLTSSGMTPAIIDGVRAAKNLFEEPVHAPALGDHGISPEFGVIGHSAGAMAAHGIVKAVQALNDPNLVLVGTAPFADQGRSIRPFVEIAAGISPDYASTDFLWPYLVYVAQGIEHFADVKGLPFDKRDMIAQEFYDYTESQDAWEQCFEELSTVTMGSVNFDEYLTEDWDSGVAVQAWMADVDQDTSYSAIPRYVHYSLHDSVSLTTPLLVDELCANDNHLYLTVSNKHHDQTLQNVPKTLDWFLELFEGQTPRLGDHEQMTGGCNVPESRPAATPARRTPYRAGSGPGGRIPCSCSRAESLGLLESYQERAVRFGEARTASLEVVMNANDAVPLVTASYAGSSYPGKVGHRRMAPAGGLRTSWRSGRTWRRKEARTRSPPGPLRWAPAHSPARRGER